MLPTVLVLGNADWIGLIHHWTSDAGEPEGPPGSVTRRWLAEMYQVWTYIGYPIILTTDHL